MAREGVNVFQADLGWSFIKLAEEVQGVMTLDLTPPLCCSFKVEVSVAQHRELLERVAARGALARLVGEECPQSYT
jgi:hypothetical protein